MSISRFNNRIKTNKKQKYVADNEYNLISTGKYKEIDVPGLGRFPVVEDDKPHASMDITVSDNSNSYYTYRGNLYSITAQYKLISVLSPRVKYIIEKAGWDRLLNMELGECLHAMVEYIVERFWDTTNTFHFPFGEMGFTPLDWVMLTGVTIGDGVDIPYDSQKYQFEYVRDNIFPYIQDALLHAKGASWISNSITVKFLSSYFVPEKLREAENDKAFAERVARAFFMYVLGQFFFYNAKNYIDAGWLAAFEDLDAVSTYDWGAAAFSRLYAALCIAGRKRKSLSGPFQVLEFWGYEYLGICAPEVVQPLDDQPIWPRCSRWKPKKKVVDIVRCRTSLNKLTADQVTWQPWESCRQILDSEIGVKTIMLSNARIIFSWNGVRKVTNFKGYVTYPDWDVPVYGYNGELHNHTMQKPAEHIHIPPQHQISPDECYSFYQEHVDFGHQLRTFTLNQSKDQMEIRRANVAEIERLKHHNHMLEVQLSQLGLAPQSQPPIGFSQFSQTIPQPVWMSMAQGSAAQTRLGSASTTSSINPTSRVNMPFLPPRSGSLEENTDDMNG